MPITNSRLSLQRWLDAKLGVQPEALTQLIQKCKDKTFLEFNNIIGLPQKDGVEHPIYDYEQSIIKLLENNKYLFILKATGLGITEICLRYILWMCMRDDSLKGTQVVILVGPSIGLAVKLVKRLKKIFEPHDIFFTTKETYLEVNGVQIECFPSHHLDSFRSLENPKIIFCSEGDFFPITEQNDVRHISERYIGKSNPTIILESTPNNPGGLFDTIAREPNSIYHKLFLDWSFGFDKIYTPEDIANAKLSTSFKREYELQFLGGTGNIFQAGVIAAATSGDYSLEPHDYMHMLKSAGLDWSSKTALTITAYVPDVQKIRVIYCNQWERADFSLLFPEIWNTLMTYGVQHLYVDGSSPSNVLFFMRMYGDDIGNNNYLERIHYYKNLYGQLDERYYEKFYHCVPINFSTDAKSLLSSFKLICDHKLFESHKIMTELHVALRTAATKDHQFSLDKSVSINNDILDSVLLSCREYSYKRAIPQ